MAGVITTGSFPKSLWPGVEAFFGMGYDEHAMECSQIFNVSTSKKKYEEHVEVTGTGLAPEKAEGAAIQYDTMTQSYTTRYTHVAYALGYIVTFEEMEDGQYPELFKGRAKALGFSQRQTRETVCANVFNRGFNSSYTGGDGKEMLATDHPTLAGNQSNELATPADLSEASLEDLLVQIMNAENNRGLKIAIRPKKLIVPPALAFDAERILKSTLQNDTANNATNAVRSMGLLPEGYMIYHYLSDSDAWFVTTDVPDGLNIFNRTEIKPMEDNDGDTMNKKVKSYQRFSVGHSDWRSVYGSAGA